MEKINRTTKRIEPLNPTKSLRSLGILEDLPVKVAEITGEPMLEIKDRVIIMMARDHGVVEEGGFR